MESDQERCFFQWKFRCETKKDPLITATAVRISNIIRCSKIYGDGKHFDLQEALNQNSELTIKCHKTCVSTYTSSRQTDRYKRQNDREADSAIPRKVTRQSLSKPGGETFNFRQHCLFCGDHCDIEKDKRHPSRWRAAYLC